MMDLLLVKLLIAHLLGDFFFQPASWVAEKERKKHASPRLYIHAAIHGLLTFLLVWDFTLWKQVLLLSVLHLVTDTIKLEFQKSGSKRNWFLADQAAHLLVILGIWYSIIQPAVPFEALGSKTFLTEALALLFLANPASILIKVVIAKWTPETQHAGEPAATSLQSAGKYIGILERLLVFLFVTTANWEAIGFLIAAKSVFRFGDLKGTRDLKMTEYILIGTLLSFGLAIVTALTALHFITT